MINIPKYELKTYNRNTIQRRIKNTIINTLGIKKGYIPFGSV